MFAEKILSILKNIVSFIIVVIVGLCAYSALEDAESQKQEEVVCIIENKDTYLISTGKITIRKYKFEVKVCDTENELRDTITVSGTIYSEHDVGDEINCIMYYDETGMKKIELAP